MPQRFQLVPAAYVLLLQDGAQGDEVLLQRRSDTGYMDGLWATGAAGHVEAGESVTAAACREAREELGVSIDPADLVPLTTMHRTGAAHTWVDERADFFFTVRRWTGEPELREGHKASDLRFFAVGALPTDIVPHERRVLDLLAQGGPPAIIEFGFDADEAVAQERAANAGH